MGFLSAIVVRFRYALLALAALVTVMFGWFLKDLRINPDVVSYFPQDDEAVRLFNYVGEHYGGTSLAIVALRAGDVFTAGGIETIAALTERFRSVDGVSYVTSLTNIIDIQSGELGIEIARLVDEYDLPTDSSQLQVLRRYAMKKDMIRGRIVSEDGSVALVVCRLTDEADEVTVARSLRAITGEMGLSDRVLLAGFPFQMMHISESIIRDLKKLVPVSCLVVVVCLFASFGTLHGVVLPLLTVLMSSVWALGLMAALNIPLTIISDVIPVILIAVGSAYSIHIVNRFDACDGAAEDNGTGVRTVLTGVGVAVLLAGLTTVVGFLSFIFGSYLTLIREFGVFSSAGIFVALLLSLTVVPAVLVIRGTRSRTKRRSTPGAGTVVSLRALGRAVRRHPWAVIAAGLAVSVVAATGIPRIERKAAILDYFKKGTPIRAAERLLEDRFGGSIPLQIVVRGDLQEPAVLEAVQAFASFLEEQPGVHNCQSVADLIEEMNDVMGEGRRIPDSRAKVVNLWFLLEGEEILTQMVNADCSEGVIQATVTEMNTQHVRRLVADIDRYMAQTDTSVCRFAQTGLHVVYRDLDESIVTTLVQSLAIALVLILACMLFVLRSFTRALLGLVPIAFTILVIFGVMGLAGLPLDIVTVLIGSVSIGIGIDYSIHIAARLTHELRTAATVEAALEATMAGTGRAVLINMLTVGLGFLVLVFAELIPLQQFGALVALTMACSGAGALSLLPAAMIVSRRGPSPNTSSENRQERRTL